MGRFIDFHLDIGAGPVSLAGMKQLLAGLLIALSLSACILSAGVPPGDFGKPPTHYQEKIRAYVARHVSHGEGARIDFNGAPAQMWVLPGIVRHGVKDWKGYQATFNVFTRGSANAQEMYADFRDDIVVDVGPYTEPPDPNY